MRKLLGFFVFAAGLSAHADVACTALANYTGEYKLVKQSCQGPWGQTLTVAPYKATDYDGYMIASGGIGIGPANVANATDKCEVSSGNVTVITGYYDRNSLPQGWVYSFSGASVSFQANGCDATFTKTK